MAIRNRQEFVKHILKLQSTPEFVRNVCIMAHVDHGKTTLASNNGVCPQTSASLRLAWKEGLKPCLVLNKIDRLFVEYRMSPMDAYRRLVQVLEQANAVAGELFVSREIEKEDFLSRRRRSMSRSSLRKSESGDEMLYFMPETGNVVFASALDNWGFRLRDFARFWSKRLHTDEELLLQSLWGDYYIDSKTKLPVFGASDKGKSPLFVVMILNNLSAIYDSMIINVEKGRIEKILNSLQLDVISKEFTKSDSRQRLQIVMSRWLPLAESVLGMVCEWLPSPKHLDNDRIERIMCGDRFAHCDYLEPKARAMKALFKQCSMEASCATTVFISKMIAVEQDLLRGKNKFMLPNSVECNYWLQAAERRSCCEVESFHSDIDEITDEMAASTSQCVFLGFARIFTGNLCSGDVLYWIPDYAMIQSGNATFREITIGQLYILEENEPLIAMIDPVTNRIDVTGNTAGRLASIRDGFDHIREELLDVCSNLGKQWSNIVQRLWAFGPRRAVVNLLLNDIDDYRRPNFFDILLDQHFDSKTGLRQYDQSIVAGFHVCCRAGPICEEPIRGVAFLVKCWDSVDGVDSMESIFGPLSGQLIVAMKEGCREAFQAQPQRLMLPMYTCIIQATGDVLGRVYSVLHRRSGKVINEKMKEGTNLFEVVASIPVVECFGFADDLRKRASGLAWPQLVFSHWEVLAMDPFWLPTTDDEIMHHGEKGEWENSAMRYVNMIRKRKGLSVNEKIVEHAEKQRNLAKKHAVSSCGCDATWLGLTVQCCQGSTVSTAFRQMPRVRHASLYTATGLERWVGAEHVLLLGKTVLLQPVCRSNDHHNNNPLNISKCSFSFAFLALFNNSTVLVCSLVVVQFFFWVGRGKIVSAQLCPFVHETEEESVHIAVPYLLLIRYSNNSMSVRVDNFCLKTIIFICKSIFLANAFLDNDVIKEPAVVCDHDRIMFTFETKNPFTGHVFVKGKYDDPNCRRDFLNNESNGATVSIRIPQCGMRRIRQLQPQATSYSVTFIVNFHPEFITKFDKAFNVRCFYSQQDKIVTAQLEVSMVPTQFLDSTTTLTPNCQYSVRAGSVNGPVVRYIKVGDLILACLSRTVMLAMALNVRCPTFSPGIQGNLNYDATLNTASVKVWAYKFPDRADLFFQCQIQICNKQSNECAAITPPHCPAASESNWTESQLSTTTTSESVTYVIGSFEQPENEKMEMPQLPGYGRRSRAVDLHRPSAIELDNLTRRLHSALKEAGFVASKAADNLTTSNSKRFPSEKDQKDFRKENDVTFSVATDMVYIADKDDANNYPFESTEKTSATCFSRTAFAMLFYSYTMLIIVVLLLTCKLCGFLNACLKRRINSKTAHQQS
ncbi:Elongation factor Tu GTP-binding domain-containing protein 1 [Trichinella pseudospiralis]|uniref:Elongation factor Tu GTP-binding domain-containing protein 1 n=1 Tax=Trichinella pseudospiralis TaxID=6337 RepID=A0A0V0XQI1_TRIPS|nr:Elongation factor Tu GTP-binding domain-containing protein 1 [Trichinella pseudospiralis]